MKLKRTLSRNNFIALLLLSALGIFAFVPAGRDPIEKIVAALEKWIDGNPIEKVYLHTDKPNYVVGDTIWFKAYVTTGVTHQLSALSGAVYVDLVTETDSLAQSIKLPITAGMAMGEFILPDSSMREGNYRIRAYTQWMRNAGSEYFYDKLFTVGNSVVSAVSGRIDFEYTGKGNETMVTAVLGYDDENGKPYLGKDVKYTVMSKSKVLASGRGTTDAKGELRVPLKNAQSDELKTAHVNTSIQVTNEDIVKKTFPVKVASLETDVQFFPEGGSFVNGVRSKIGFKATGTNGLGVPIKGAVVDQSGTEVGSFEAEHVGMGFFLLAPEKGKTYSAKVTYPDGSTKTLPLPKATDVGYALSVFNNPDTILVRVSADAAAVEKGSSLSLVIQSSGEVMFATEVQIDRPTVSLRIPAKEINSGIAQFTLFSADNMPLNERIVFIQHDDQAKLTLNTAKKVYAKREKIEIDLNALDPSGKPLLGNYSASVVNEDAVPVDEAKEHTLLSHVLLSSDINGYIENPNYYFMNPSEESKARLDLLMLTQGYRRFTWKDLLGGNIPAPKFQKESLITEVTGRLMTLGNKPVAGGKVKLFNVKLGLDMDTLTDANGRFKFSNLLVTSGVMLTLQGRTAKDGKNVEVLLDRVAGQTLTPGFNIGDMNVNITKSLSRTLENSKKQDKELERFGRLSRTQELREIVIRSRRPRTATSYGITVQEGHADQTVKFDPGSCVSLLDCMRMNVRQVVFNMDNSGECGPVNVPYSRGERMRVVVNGRVISDCEFQDVLEMSPDNVERIDVVRTNQALISRIGGAAILIVTKTRGTRTVYNPSVLSFDAGGFSNAKQFYVPKYDAVDASPVTDLRTTVYWNPSIITDANGKAKFSFFNGDGVGNYRVVVEGIDASGLLGRQVYKYQVK